MIRKWFLEITYLSVYRCRACRKLVETPKSMAPLFNHMAEYHAGAWAEATASGRQRDVVTARAAAA